MQSLHGLRKRAHFRVFATLDPEIAGHVPGYSALSGSNQIGGFLNSWLELAEDDVSIDVHSVLSDGDPVVALVTVNAQKNPASAAFP